MVGIHWKHLSNANIKRAQNFFSGKIRKLFIWISHFIKNSITKIHKIGSSDAGKQVNNQDPEQN